MYLCISVVVVLHLSLLLFGSMVVLFLPTTLLRVCQLWQIVVFDDIHSQPHTNVHDLHNMKRNPEPSLLERSSSDKKVSRQGGLA